MFSRTSLAVLQRQKARQTEHERAPRILGSRERLHQTQVHQRWIAFQHTGRIGEVAQGCAFAPARSSEAWPSCFAFNTSAEGALEVGREHHVLHFDSEDVDADLRGFRLHAGEQLCAEFESLIE